MEPTPNYFCVFCEQELYLDETISMVCPRCHEYKGLTPISEKENYEDNE